GEHALVEGVGDDYRDGWGGGAHGANYSRSGDDMRAPVRWLRDDAAAGVAVSDGGLGHKARHPLARIAHHESSDGGTAAGEVRGHRAGLARALHDRLQTGEDLAPDGLVVAVLGGVVEDLEAALGQGGDEHGDASEVEHGVLAGEGRAGNTAAPLLCRHLEVG